MLPLLNFLLCQIGWFASVLGGAHQLPWVGPVVVALVIAWHLNIAARPGAEAMLILVCGIVGAAFDSTLVAAGWLSYPSGVLSASLAPYWIVAMWMLFATTLNSSLRWLRDRSALSAGTGFVAGPLSYIAGAELGGVEFVNQQAALTALALGWAVVLPALTTVAMRFDGVTVKSPSLSGSVR